ncbi:MAG: glycosyltransferase [Coriobacteriia bacterium]|nr:glycosyltransferase [Coriobacteriia bacterium]
MVIFTGEWNREFIEPLREGAGLEDVVYVDVARQRSGVLGRAKVVGHYYVYAAWQRAAAGAIELAHREQAFDLVHHVTYGAVWLPTYLWRLEVPVLLGPLGGAERVPHGLRRALGLQGVVRELVRVLTQEMFALWRPVRRGLQHASLCLAKTAESERWLLDHGARAVVQDTELSIPAWLDDDCMPSLGTHPSTQDAVFMCVGRLQEFKGQRLAIEAFASVRARLPEAVMVLYGDGPDRSHLERRVSQLGMEGSVVFAGQVPRDAAVRAMRQATAMVHPALHDSSGNVVVEAMACGLPVITLKTGGSAVLADERVAVMVRPSSWRSTVDDLASAMIRIVEEPVHREALSSECRSYAKSRFSLVALGDRIERVYRTACETVVE